MRKIQCIRVVVSDNESDYSQESRAELAAELNQTMWLVANACETTVELQIGQFIMQPVYKSRAACEREAREALLKLAAEGGFSTVRSLLKTAYRDRDNILDMSLSEVKR